jgi:CRISPR-associated protein Csm4
MQAFRVTINLQSAFATTLKGDTLFGQLCWAIRNRQGENHLAGLLEGYTSGQPFAVVSDAFPKGYLPLPKLPGHFYDKIDGIDRKTIKKRCWLPEEVAGKPVTQWLEQAKTASDVIGQAKYLSKKTRNRTTPSTARPILPVKAVLRPTASNRNGS